MIPVYYDLHIHSALSPCCDNDMTPNDIVGMAVLNNLDLIAVTDHNSFSNVKAVIKAAQDKELIVLPGIEVATVEEVHVICLFSEPEEALSFENELIPFFSSLPNRTDIFGSQFLYDENDNIAGEVDRMLLAPASISFDDLHTLTNKYNGAFIPAHIDRDSFSVISNLGFLPPHLDINTVEISQRGIEKGYAKKNENMLSGKKIVFSSDAHQLWSINDKIHFMMLPERTARAAVDFLR